MFGQFEQREDDNEMNIEWALGLEQVDLVASDDEEILWASCEETEQRFLVNDFEVYEVDGIVYMDLRYIDPTQMGMVASSGQASEPQQGAVKGRPVHRFAMSPGFAIKLMQAVTRGKSEDI